MNSGANLVIIIGEKKNPDQVFYTTRRVIFHRLFNVMNGQERLREATDKQPFGTIFSLEGGGDTAMSLRTL